MEPKALGDLYVVTKARQAAGEELTAFERDAIYIAEMVVRIDEDDETRARYTCKHFDDKAGRCLAYDSRPAMCRDYPNYGCAGACTFCGFSEPAPVAP
jgi:Fe-S-cluster containining protein